MGLAVAAVLATAGLARGLPAQQPRPLGRPVAGDTTRPSLDSLRRASRLRMAMDTMLADSVAAPRDSAARPLVDWREPDSVMAALLARPGFTTTRYQGDRVTFDADARRLRIAGNAAVQRGQTVLVGDTVVYDDRERLVAAIGDTIVLRDPGQGAADLVARGQMAYNLRTHRGEVSNLSTSVQQNQTWYVSGQRYAFQGDSTGGRDATVFYGRSGAITSCSLTEPHYHFESREIKYRSKRWIVARPAVLYIADIPVLWLPFIFQDLRSGRRSGILPPRFGLTDVVRTTPNYRRQIDNVGYYFALNDYMDARVSLDWRSGASATPQDPGWTRYNGAWNYNWLSRFLSGGIAASYSTYSTGQRNLALSWRHQQQFSQRTSFTADLNYVKNTIIQRQQAFTANQALATIRSSLNFQQQLGPASLSIGGSRSQYVGRSQVDQVLPNLSLSTRPLSPVSWLVWTPRLSLTNTQQLNSDQVGGGLAYRYQLGLGGVLDSVQNRVNTRNTTATFDTPLQIGGFTWQNSFSATDQQNDFPRSYVIRDVNDSSNRVTRVYNRSYATSVDWRTGINLPALLQGTWNIVPSVQIVNVDPGGFWVRSQLTGGSWVSQSKRLQYGLSVSPTFFGLFPGFGPFSRLRHTIQPQIRLDYAPAATVSDAYLAATNRTRAGYLGSLAQNRVTLTLQQVLEAKLQQRGDSAAGEARKIKLLSLDFSALTYDFERARKTGRSGFSTPSFTYSLRSDLLPGFDLRVGYSLFQGDYLSDTARFSPYRQTIDASFSLGRDNNPFTAFARLFGLERGRDSTRAAAAVGPVVPGMGEPSSVAGGLGPYPSGIPQGQGWNASLTFSSQRRRPPVGTGITEFDPTLRCSTVDPLFQESCIRQQLAIQDTIQDPIAGGIYVRTPPTATLRGDVGFQLTPSWAVQWTTGYDFVQKRFSDHQVQLQRNLHDWRAVFGFTQSPNGNFAFTFFISLIAQPDLKFDYSRRTYRPGF